MAMVIGVMGAILWWFTWRWQGDGGSGGDPNGGGSIVALVEEVVGETVEVA